MTCFQDKRYTSAIDWADTREGIIFCKSVIMAENFALFFEKYRRTEETPYTERETSGHRPISPMTVNGNPLPTMPLEWFQPYTPPGGPTSHGTIAKFDSEKDLYNQRLYETAKAAMQGIVSHGGAAACDSYAATARESIRFAKELLRQLDEEFTTKHNEDIG